MSITPSTMLALGTTAPDFTLPNVVTEEQLTLQQLASKRATVVMFICNHCPFVIHILDKLVSLADDYQQKGINFIAISANDISTHPPDLLHNFLRQKDRHRRHGLPSQLLASILVDGGLNRALGPR